jgi:hypothetical protein
LAWTNGSANGWISEEGECEEAEGEEEEEEDSRAWELKETTNEAERREKKN